MTIPICILPGFLWPLQSQATSHLSAPPVSKACSTSLECKTNPSCFPLLLFPPQLGSTASPSHLLAWAHPCFVSLGSPGCTRTAWRAKKARFGSLLVYLNVCREQTNSEKSLWWHTGWVQARTSLTHTHSEWTSALTQPHDIPSLFFPV